jgi:hypothetical protein
MMMEKTREKERINSELVKTKEMREKEKINKE